jgi:hypothetical protein
LQKFIDNVPIDLLALPFQNTERNGRKVELVVTLSLNHKGCKIVTIDFLPKDNHAESWLYYFYKFAGRYTLDADVSFFETDDINNVAIVFSVEQLDNGKCRFALPKPIGELVWSALKTNGMFQHKDKRIYDLMVPHGYTECKGIRIVLRNPVKKAKMDLLSGLRTAIIPIKSKINWGDNDHVI